MVKKITLSLNNEVGLHARPASLFVKVATGSSSDILVRNLSEDTEWINAKSILSVLTLGAEQGHQIEIHATGEDEEDAIKTLQKLVISNFSDHQEGKDQKEDE